MPEIPPPFAPPRAQVVCPGLLALAARSGLGGTRELLLGAVMAARLAVGLRGPYAIPRPARALRAEAARAWLGALTLPAKVRSTLLRAYLATAADDLAVAADTLGQVTDITAPHLDRVARSELVRLADGLRSDAAALAATPD